MKRTTAERAQSERFEKLYVRAQAPVMLAAERSVCGCDYGGTSWTTRQEAERIGALLHLRSGMRLLDVGAGSGWPALYLAKTTGCDVALLDLPVSGLRIAADRARKDGLDGTCRVAVADACGIPFRAGSFDAVSHNDLLCCLVDKRAVLEECRRVIKEGGRMAFTVISVAPGLSSDDYDRAVANGPEFVESDDDYRTLLDRTGWTVLAREDMTNAFASSVHRQLQVDDERKDALRELIGASEFAQRTDGWRSKLAALNAGLLRRELFVADPRVPGGIPRRRTGAARDAGAGRA